MAEEKPTRRDWSGIGCAAVLAILVGLFVYARWPDPERDLVRQRDDFASWLAEQGGGLTLADSSKPEGATVPISERRQRLGDKPIRAVTLPYGYPESVTAKAKSLFPEAVEWSVLSGDTAIVRLFGDPKAIEHPDRVEAQRLTGENKSPRTKATSLADYPTKGDVVEVSPQIAARISAGLLDPKSYQWHEVFLCSPTYDVRLTFFRADAHVDVLFCFECGVLLTFSNEHPVGGEPFSYAHDVFADAMKELFPNDEQIQTIGPRDERGVRIDKSFTPPADDSTPSATGSGQAPTPGR
jgi:hypothetical protein